MKGATSYHDVRERIQGGSILEVEQWRMAGGRLYEKRRSAGGEPRVRVAAGVKGFEMEGNQARPLRSAEIVRWRRQVRMVPANFEAHVAEMEVVSTVEGGIEKLEAVKERLVLERDARSGVPRKASDLRSKHTILFEEPKDAQGRHVPRREVHLVNDREKWRDRLLAVEFDAPVPEEIQRLWLALESGELPRPT